MKELENLKELYLDEIKAINKKGELTPTDAEAAKKALEAIEKINKLCCDDEYEDEGYSERMYPRYSRNSSYRGDYSYTNRSMMPEMRPYDYDHMGYSERRGRSATTGRYISRHAGSDNDNMVIDDIIAKLENMKNY